MGGLPDIDDYDSYGGERVNEAPVEDPTTDVDADDLCRSFANVAGMTHTLDRAWRRFVGDSTTPKDPTTNVDDAVWGNPLPIRSVVTRMGVGVYSITWPATIVDYRGASHTVNFRKARASVEGPTPYLVNAKVTAANAVTIWVYNSEFAPDDGVGVTFLVEVC